VKKDSGGDGIYDILIDYVIEKDYGGGGRGIYILIGYVIDKDYSCGGGGGGENAGGFPTHCHHNLGGLIRSSMLEPPKYCC